MSFIVKMNTWYMDDGVIVGDEESLLKTIEIIQTFGFGIELNLQKCEIFALGQEASRCALNRIELYLKGKFIF